MYPPPAGLRKVVERAGGFGGEAGRGRERPTRSGPMACPDLLGHRIGNFLRLLGERRAREAPAEASQAVAGSHR